VVEAEDYTNRVPIAKFHRADLEWWTGSTVLHTWVKNVGEARGGYMVELWFADGDGNEQNRQAPQKGLPLGEMDERWWLVASNEMVTVTRVLLYTTSHPEPWLLTDSLTTSDINKPGPP
jgi:hypothetical protein